MCRAGCSSRVMSAGIVMVVWAVAEDQLSSMLTKALNKVK